jgi:hypothetical protein
MIIDCQSVKSAEGGEASGNFLDTLGCEWPLTRTHQLTFMQTSWLTKVKLIYV